MNHVPCRNGTAAEIGHIREVVSRHPLPDFVSGFEVHLGEFAGDPAMWIVFKIVGGEPTSEEAMQNRVKDIGALRHVVQDDLLDVFDDRWPYLRFEPVE